MRYVCVNTMLDVICAVLYLNSEFILLLFTQLVTIALLQCLIWRHPYPTKPERNNNYCLVIIHNNSNNFQLNSCGICEQSTIPSVGGVYRGQCSESW